MAHINLTIEYTLQLKPAELKSVLSALDLLAEEDIGEDGKVAKELAGKLRSMRASNAASLARSMEGK